MVALMVIDLEKSLGLKYEIKIPILKVKVTKVEDNYAIFVTFSRIDEALKFLYSEKAPKFCKISTLILSVCTVDKSKVEISQNFVAFSECTNFKEVLFFQYI